MGLLEGQIALVTGASRGLGAGIARAFAREGARVAVNCRTRVDKATEVVRDIEQSGGQAMLVQADCTDEAHVDDMVREVTRELGPIEILMNNAGDISQMPFVEMPVNVWDQMMASHLRSHFLVTKACLPGMMKLTPKDGRRRAAKIINMSSGIGQKGGRGGAGPCPNNTTKTGGIA